MLSPPTTTLLTLYTITLPKFIISTPTNTEVYDATYDSNHNWCGDLRIIATNIVVNEIINETITTGTAKPTPLITTETLLISNVDVIISNDVVINAVFT